MGGVTVKVLSLPPSHIWPAKENSFPLSAAVAISNLPRPVNGSDKPNMAVMSLRWLVAASALLPPVSAGTRPNPRGPVQTAAPDLKDANIGVAPRVVTDSPAPRGLLQKRATNTCGYVDGDSSQQHQSPPHRTNRLS
jgi:hypothetical protein